MAAGDRTYQRRANGNKRWQRYRGRTQAAIRAETMPAYDKADDRARYYSDPWIVKAAPGGVSRLRTQYQSALFALVGIVTLVLLVACTSIAMLMLARSTARRHEFGVRRALGATRGRLLRQLLIESLIVSVAGAILGVLLARWGSQVLVAQLSTFTGTTRPTALIRRSVIAALAA